MGKRRARERANRMQKIVAVVLLLSLTLSGLAFYAASITSSPQPTAPTTQQGH
jgi:hypothetical protein